MMHAQALELILNTAKISYFFTKIEVVLSIFLMHVSLSFSSTGTSKRTKQFGTFPGNYVKEVKL